MALKNGKNSYDDVLNDARKMAEDDEIPAEGSFSLEEILAEYGESRKQKILADVEKAAVPDSGKTEGSPASDAPKPAVPSIPPEKPQPSQEQPLKAQPEARPQKEFQNSPRQREAAAPEKSREPEELPRAPRPVSLEQIVGQTVDQVMEEQEPLLPEKKQRKGLFSRRRMVETEELYSQPEKETPQEPQPEPIGPEEPLDEMANRCRSAINRQRRPLPAAVLVTVLVSAVLALGEKGISIPFWTGDPVLQTIVLAGALMVVCLLCRSVFQRGFSMLLHRHCTGELLISLSALAALGDCVSRLLLPERTDAMPYAAAACAALTFSQWGSVRGLQAKYDTYRTAAMSDEPPYLVTDTSDGACKQAGRIPGFYTDTVKKDLPCYWQTAILPVILMGTVVFAGLSSLGQGKGQDALLCWSAILAAGASFSFPLCWSLPYSHLACQLQKCGCAVAGWAGASAISRKKTMILTDLDLFPPGTIRLNGIKLFGEEMSHAVSYAASMVRSSGSGLNRMFEGLVRSENGHYCTVEDFSFYEEGGCSGTINGESILLGTASFMRKMEVRLPGNLKLHTGIFLASDRQLIAVFAVKYSASENVDWALQMLRHNHITPILASRDANITPTLLKRKFRKNVKVEYPTLASRLALSEAENDSGMPHALLLREGLMPYAETVAGSLRLCRAARRCTVISLLGSVAGVLLAFYLTFEGSFSLMTPVTLLVYQLLWTVPVLLSSGWAGRF